MARPKKVMCSRKRRKEDLMGLSIGYVTLARRQVFLPHRGTPCSPRVPCSSGRALVPEQATATALGGS